MGRRYILKGKTRAYVHRNRKGQFSKWVSRGRSYNADRRIHAVHHPRKSGYGHTGDYVRIKPQLRRLPHSYKRIRVRGFLRKL